MQPWVMRPWRSTWVASTTTRPAPEFASMPRWAMCQSVAQPSTELYWHIGATTMRFSNATPPSLIGENRVLDIGWGPLSEGDGQASTQGTHILTDDAAASGMPCKGPKRARLP